MIKFYRGVPVRSYLSTKIDFIENQLSHVPVCLSLLTQFHRNLLPQILVQANNLELGEIDMFRVYCLILHKFIHCDLHQTITHWRFLRKANYFYI